MPYHRLLEHEVADPPPQTPHASSAQQAHSYHAWCIIVHVKVLLATVTETEVTIATITTTDNAIESAEMLTVVAGGKESRTKYRPQTERKKDFQVYVLAITIIVAK